MKTAVKPLNLYPQQPMNKEVTMAMVNLTLNPELGEEVYDEAVGGGDFAMMVGVKRAEAFDIKVDKATMVFVCAMLARNPGTIVMYLHAIYQHQQVLKERGEDREYNLTDLCNIFAMGFPNEQALGIAWDAQKGDHEMKNIDNMLDHKHLFQARYVAAA